MGFSTDAVAFKKFVQECGNEYAATLAIARRARLLAQFVDNTILDSEAITSVLNEDIQTVIRNHIRKQKIRLDNIKLYLQERTDYIYDINVRNAVYASSLESIQSNHLVYIYGTVEDTDRRSRIRVLTRIIFYEFNQERNESYMDMDNTIEYSESKPDTGVVAVPATRKKPGPKPGSRRKKSVEPTEPVKSVNKKDHVENTTTEPTPITVELKHPIVLYRAPKHNLSLGYISGKITITGKTVQDFSEVVVNMPEVGRYRGYVVSKFIRQYRNISRE